MVKLTLEELKKRSEWAKAGIGVPTFDIEKMKEETKAHPRWVHVGPGNIFRGFIADLADILLESGDVTSGITVVSTFDQQVISKIYEPFDDLALRVVMAADGSLSKKVVAGVGDVLRADAEYPSEWARCREIFRTPELQMVSFTITEKGYHIKDLAGNYYPTVQAAFEDASL